MNDHSGSTPDQILRLIPPHPDPSTAPALRRALPREGERSLLAVALQIGPKAAAELLGCLTAEDFEEQRMAAPFGVLKEAAAVHAAASPEVVSHPPSGATGHESLWDRN